MAERDTVLQMRLTPEEKEGFETAAQLSGLTLSSWARQALRRASAAELRPMGFKVPFAEAIRNGNV